MHFEIEVEDGERRWSRRQQKIEAAVRLDGIYIVRTEPVGGAAGADEAVLAYNSLTRMERAFRSLKTTQLRARPLYVYSEEHLRWHVFVCMLACYVEWHLRRRLAPLLFEDGERKAAATRRDSPVKSAEVSQAAEAKAAGKRTPEGLPVQSLRTLLEHLGTLALNRVTLTRDDPHELELLTQKTPLQAAAFALLGVDPARIVSSKLTV